MCAGVCVCVFVCVLVSVFLLVYCKNILVCQDCQSWVCLYIFHDKLFAQDVHVRFCASRLLFGCKRAIFGSTELFCAQSSVLGLFSDISSPTH